jgi:uncharacterized protein YndB with AHSA1/START domain
MKQPGITPIEIHQRLSAPVEDVFDAWTDPLAVKKWMFLGEFNNIIQVIIDLQPGGEFSVVKKTDEGYLRDYYGKYHEVSRPALLSFSLEAPDAFPGTSNVVIRFQPIEDGCKMVFLQTGVEPSTAEQPWRQMFEQLNRLLTQGAETPGAVKRPVDHHLL